MELGVDAVGEGDVIVVEVISFGDEEAVTSIMPSCSEVETVLVSIRAAVGLK